MWLPFATVVVLNAVEYGEVVSFPNDTPSRKNSTRTTATLSVAFAAAVTVPVTVEPLAGDVIEELGGTTSVGIPLFQIATWMILLSVILHGLTARPLAAAYGERIRAEDPTAPELVELPQPRVRRQLSPPLAEAEEPGA